MRADEEPRLKRTSLAGHSSTLVPIVRGSELPLPTPAGELLTLSGLAVHEAPIARPPGPLTALTVATVGHKALAGNADGVAAQAAIDIGHAYHGGSLLRHPSRALYASAGGNSALHPRLALRIGICSHALPPRELRHAGLKFRCQSPHRLRTTGALDLALTLDIYSHVLPQADQEAADRIAALIEL